MWRKLREQIAVAQVVEPGDGQHRRDFRSPILPGMFPAASDHHGRSQPWSREREGYKAGWTRVIRRYSWCEKQVPALGRNDNHPHPSRKKHGGTGGPTFSSVAGIGPNCISHRTVTIQNLPMVQRIHKSKLGRSALVRQETRPQTTSQANSGPRRTEERSRGAHRVL